MDYNFVQDLKSVREILELTQKNQIKPLKRNAMEGTA